MYTPTVPALSRRVTNGNTQLQRGGESNVAPRVRLGFVGRLIDRLIVCRSIGWRIMSRWVVTHSNSAAMSGCRWSTHSRRLAGGSSMPNFAIPGVRPACIQYASTACECVPCVSCDRLLLPLWEGRIIPATIYLKPSPRCLASSVYFLPWDDRAKELSAFRLPCAVFTFRQFHP